MTVPQALLARPLSPRDMAPHFARLLTSPKAALAVSGGADSTALMLLLHDWLQTCDQNNPTPEIHVLSVDHQLRASSKVEAEWVCALAKHLNFKTALLTWDHTKPQTRIQDMARKARYALMTAYCHQHHIPILLTAHHLEDQAETVLMRLARGAGIDGLSAMERISEKNGITIYRPCLSIPKSRLIASLQARGQSWHEDPGNENDDYERVRIRKALPLLAELGITPEALAKSAMRLRRSQKACEEVALNLFKNSVTIHQAGYCTLPLTQFQDIADDTAIRLLRLAIEQTRGLRLTLRLSKLEDTLLHVRHLKEHKAITCGGCLLKKQKGGILYIMREIRSPGQLETYISPGQSLKWDNRFTIHLPADAPKSLLLRALGTDGLVYLNQKIDNEEIDKKHLSNVPKEALLTLPSLWDAQNLISVPYFDAF